MSSFCKSDGRSVNFRLSLVHPLTLFFDTDRASARSIKRHDNVLRSALYGAFSESLAGMSTIRAYQENTRFITGVDRAIDIENR